MRVLGRKLSELRGLGGLMAWACGSWLLIAPVYRNEYLPEKRKALKAWSSHLEELADEGPDISRLRPKKQVAEVRVVAEVIDLAARARARRKPS